MAETNPIDWLGNFVQPFLVGGGRPVFLGDRKIGEWTDVGNLCTGGVINLEVPADQAGTPAQWTTKDDWWRTVSVLGYCKAVGYPTPWATSADVAAAPPALPGAAIQNGPVREIVSLPTEIGQAFDSVGNAVTGGLNGDVAKWAAVGGLGLAGFLLIMRAAEPRRRRR